MATRLYVGNLPYRATEDDLREHFEQVGQVNSIHMPASKEDGTKNRGFAFIEMAESDAQDAIAAFNEQQFLNRAIRVNVARPEERRDNGRYREWREFPEVR